MTASLIPCSGHAPSRHSFSSFPAWLFYPPISGCQGLLSYHINCQSVSCLFILFVHFAFHSWAFGSQYERHPYQLILEIEIFCLEARLSLFSWIFLSYWKSIGENRYSRSYSRGCYSNSRKRDPHSRCYSHYRQSGHP